MLISPEGNSNPEAAGKKEKRVTSRWLVVRTDGDLRSRTLFLSFGMLLRALPEEEKFVLDHSATKNEAMQRPPDAIRGHKDEMWRNRFFPRPDRPLLWRRRHVAGAKLSVASDGAHKT